MKLTRFQLVHATDKQLDAIGVKRRFNAGWLKKALETDWTNEDLTNFTAVTFTSSKTFKTHKGAVKWMAARVAR